MRSGNPVLSDNTFSNGAVDEYNRMTLQGTVNKTGILLIMLVFSAFFVWQKAFTGESVNIYMMVGFIGGFIIALITVFKKTASPITAPLYAIFEGAALGGLSAIFEMKYPGIVIQAVGLTFGTLFALLFAYSSRMIKATENFKLGVAAATGGIMIFYIINMILGFFGVSIPYIHESGMIGIGFSLFVVVIAALNLVLDFDFIENGVNQGAPKYMEWFASFGLLVTLVWLYLEILRLLAKLQGRSRD